MGATARAMSPATRGAPRVRSSTPAPRGRSSAQARCRDAFRGAFMLMLLLTAVGLVRVYVAAESVEAALDSGRIRAEITEERRVGARLEVDRSALAMPSRIEGIASQSMKMAEPNDVDYIEVAPEAAPTGDASQATARAGQEVPEALAALLRFAAGEAQALLVGDVGLATAR